jgi:hypothetical protein
VLLLAITLHTTVVATGTAAVDGDFFSTYISVAVANSLLLLPLLHPAAFKSPMSSGAAAYPVMMMMMMMMMMMHASSLLVLLHIGLPYIYIIISKD